MQERVRPMELASWIVGVWRLTKFISEETETKEISTPFGEEPSGHMVFTAGGHVMALGVGSGRRPLSASHPTDAERAELFKTLFAYSGRYRIEGETIVHDVEASWNEGWTGTAQVRMAKVDGNTLAVRTAPFRSPQTGQEVVATAYWERVE